MDVDNPCPAGSDEMARDSSAMPSSRADRAADVDGFAPGKASGKRKTVDLRCHDMREELIRRHPGGIRSRTGNRESAGSRPSLARGFASDGDGTGYIRELSGRHADAVERLREITPPESIAADARLEGFTDVEGAVLEARGQLVWLFHASMMADAGG